MRSKFVAFWFLLSYLCAGCATTTALSENAAAASAAAIRYAVTDVCTDWPPCDVVFVSVSDRDAPPGLLDQLRDLNARPVSKAEFVPNDADAGWLQPVDRETGKKGHHLRVKAIVIDNDQATIEMFYGTCDCNVILEKRNGSWSFVERDIQSIVAH